MPHTDEFLDDSTVWGVRCNKSLAPSPKSPGDFRSAAQLASTPFHRLPADCVHPLEDKGVHCALSVLSSANFSSTTTIVVVLKILIGTLENHKEET